MGGLGNQLFQYSFARHLAYKHNVDLKLDVTGLSAGSSDGVYTIRELGLGNFDIRAGIASENELKIYQKNKFGKMVDLFYLFLPFKVNRLYVKEPFFHFFKNALLAPEDCYLDGYWQSEKYFKESRKELLSELKLCSSLSEKSKEIESRINESQSVSIHVRRGDYISDPHNQNIYETCGADYYLKAMDKIAETVKRPVFYVFSDEPDWFMKNIHSSYSVEYITHNLGKDSYQDLHLMSLCNHNIIANSSFSWWGAWLNPSDKKIVIAPRSWFKDKRKDTKDLIPQSWIQL